MAKTINYRGLKDRDRTHRGRKYEGRIEDGANADVTPGESIRIFGCTEYGESYDKTFEIGDYAIYGSYNLTYTGPITAIGPKTVTIDASDTGERPKRIPLYTFSWRNKFYNAAKIAARNARVSMEI